MPSFEFTSPEGKKYTVSGPDGATKEQAFQVLQQQIAAGTAQAASVADQIPVSVEERAFGARQPTVTPQPSAPADPSLVDQLVGGGETALALATGATTGALGTLGGAAKGLVGSVMDGTYGTQQGVQNVERAAAQGGDALTYSPRTAAGQEMTQAAGDAVNSAVPLMPLTAEMGALGRGASMAGAAARDIAPAAIDSAGTAALDAAAATARAVKGVPRAIATGAKGAFSAASDAALTRMREIAPNVAARVERTLSRNPEPVKVDPASIGEMPVDGAEFNPSLAAMAADAAAPAASVPQTAAGTLASVGAAATDIADQRRQIASGLPVPLRLTQGQAERSFEQQRFEREMAKEPSLGEPIRDRFAQQNEDIMKNFDSWVDQTGAQAPNLRAVGTAVDQALVKKAARDKAEIRVAYKNAEKAGEMAAPVSLNSVVDYLNASAPDAATAPVLNAIRQHAIKLGIAEDLGGQLVPAQPERPKFSSLTNAPSSQPGVTLKTAETLRQAINRATDYEPTNIRQATIIKGLIDSATENAGGDLYRAARRLRENFAKQYEDRAVIAKLLNNKKGMADRQVALEDIWSHAIMNGGLDDVRQVRRVLQTGGAEGQQAWRELQGQTLNWIKDEATKNVATDTRGNPIVSADKLNKAIRSIDADGKMDFIFGKRGAQQLRDINDLAKAVFTAPPGTVNSSNMASVLLAALAEAGATGSLTGIPVPVLSGLRMLAKHAKNRQIQKRIEQALNHRAAAPTTPPSRPSSATLH